jgi:hypothetical protein
MDYSTEETHNLMETFLDGAWLKEAGHWSHVFGGSTLSQALSVSLSASWLPWDKQPLLLHAPLPWCSASFQAQIKSRLASQPWTETSETMSLNKSVRHCLPGYCHSGQKCNEHRCVCINIHTYLYKVGFLALNLVPASDMPPVSRNRALYTEKVLSCHKF